ncbi:MAG TPA: hypothetical protein VHI52_06640 [Verrucomicrobiae bacterium]|nr:hypothetical protein [Verrucomicrobiae bacterium]
MSGTVLAQPASELFEASGGVGKLVLGQRLILIWVTQANVELVFADINAEYVLDFHVTGYGHEVWLGEASGTNWLVEDLTRIPARRSGYGSIWPKTGSRVRSPQGAHCGSSAAWVYPVPLLKRPQGVTFIGDGSNLQARLSPLTNNGFVIFL